MKLRRGDNPSLTVGTIFLPRFQNLRAGKTLLLIDLKVLEDIAWRMSKGWLPCDARSAGSNASSTGSGFGLRLVDHRRKHRDLQSWWTQGASPRAR
ncbi:hypothetical protein CPSG_08834 [Coccidioides posadasii str. Silveira]|uniref:Uncharacterized protein n=1 Tax=Coccidioides posadasii (strain RMSCC 757 / Silveira) TaxID=443226 RepID=E9DG85_COCPS|nr:hypothetical protein CPSG_08834 [Coccidioides posadasii str. Silveira]